MGGKQRTTIQLSITLPDDMPISERDALADRAQRAIDTAIEDMIFQVIEEERGRLNEQFETMRASLREQTRKELNRLFEIAIKEHIQGLRVEIE